METADGLKVRTIGAPRIFSAGGGGGDNFFLYILAIRVRKLTLRKLFITLQASSVLPRSKKLQKADF